MTSRKDMKKRAVFLRKQGETLAEISIALLHHVSKGTLSNWLKGVEMSSTAQKRLHQKSNKYLHLARASARQVNSAKRKIYLESLRNENKEIIFLIQKKNVAKIALAMLYLGEGGKQGGSVSFSNSNPEVIRIFLGLLRAAYVLEEKKFRVTVQCRVDQSKEKLEVFWKRVTQIPLSQFYHAQIDKRSLGKVTIKKRYKGVCRIDYFSAHVFNELRIIVELILGR